MFIYLDQPIDNHNRNKYCDKYRRLIGNGHQNSNRLEKSTAQHSVTKNKLLNKVILICKLKISKIPESQLHSSVQNVDIFTESVDNPTQRSGIEEVHRGVHYTDQELPVKGPGGQ